MAMPEPAGTHTIINIHKHWRTQATAVPHSYPYTYTVEKPLPVLQKLHKYFT